MNISRVLIIALVATCLQVPTSKSQSVSSGQVSTRAYQQLPSLSVSLENSVVTKYLTDAATSYDNTIGREGSSLLSDSGGNWYLEQVEQKATFIPGWTEQPQSVTIPAEGGSSVQLSTSPAFSEALTFSVTSGEAEAYNLVPQTVYWYRVLSSSGKVLSNGIFKTQGRLRMLKAENVLNIRDLGGWPVYDVTGNVSGRLAYGKLVRGATFDGYYKSYCGTPGITDAGIEMLLDAGISAEFDLRDDDEYVTQNPLGCDDDAFERETMDYYMYLFAKKPQSSCQHVGNFLSFIKTQIAAGRCTYFHCSAGADRTGCMALIIEALCGVSEADIVKDWELTSFATRVLSDIYTLGRIIDDPDMGYDEDGDGHKEFTAEMRSVFQYLYDNYGGSEGANVQQQVISWLKENVYADNPSEVDNLVSFFQSNLVERAVKAPTIIVDQTKETGAFEDLLIYEDQTTIMSTEGKSLAVDGSEVHHDAYSITDYIDCTDYSQLLINVKDNVIAVFYDAQKEVVGVLTDDAITSETVLFGDAEYQISDMLQRGAQYVRFNVPNYSGWTAVLSNRTYLQ